MAIGIALGVLFFSWATARDTTAFSTCNTSKSWVSGETTGVPILTTFFANTGVKFLTVFSFVGSSSFHAASFGSRHRGNSILPT